MSLVVMQAQIPVSDFTRADAPSWGRALASGFVNLCWQPSGYALYNGPIRTNSYTCE